MATRFVRVTDPDVAQGLYANGLLYEKHVDFDNPELAADWSPHTEWSYRMRYKDWSFYVRMED